MAICYIYYQLIQWHVPPVVPVYTIRNVDFGIIEDAAKSIYLVFNFLFIIYKFHIFSLLDTFVLQLLQHQFIMECHTNISVVSHTS